MFHQVKMPVAVFFTSKAAIKVVATTSKFKSSEAAAAGGLRRLNISSPAPLPRYKKEKMKDY